MKNKQIELRKRIMRLRAKRQTAQALGLDLKRLELERLAIKTEIEILKSDRAA